MDKTKIAAQHSVLSFQSYEKDHELKICYTAVQRCQARATFGRRQNIKSQNIRPSSPKEPENWLVWKVASRPPVLQALHQHPGSKRNWKNHSEQSPKQQRSIQQRSRIAYQGGKVDWSYVRFAWFWQEGQSYIVCLIKLHINFIICYVWYSSF